MFRNGGRQAGFVFCGDSWTLIAAQLNFSRFLVHNRIFSCLDFFTHNGASEYFLRPNLPVYHPLLLLLSFLFPLDAAPGSLAEEYLLLLAVPAFFSAFFIHRLASRYFYFDGPLSTFVSVGYVFSIQICDSIWYPPFALAAWMFPIVVYGGLAAVESRCVRTTIIWSAAPFIAFLSGYVALCTVAVGISAVVVVLLSLDRWRGKPKKTVLRELCWGLSPFFTAVFFVLPYYIEVMRFHVASEVYRGGASLENSAYNLAQPVGRFLHAIFRNITFTVNVAEFDLYIGLVPLFIVVLFCALPSWSRREVLQNRFMLVSLSVFLFFSLSIFGTASPVSDILYFFVPIAGYMHIYQRYLGIVQLFLVVFIAYGLNAVAQTPPLSLIRKISIVGILFSFGLSTIIGHSLWGILGPITDRLVLEILFAVLFLLSFFVCSRRGVIISATIAIFLVSLSCFYSMGQGPHNDYRNKSSEDIMFSREVPSFLAKISELYPNKEVVKYVDLLRHPDKAFIPKNFPWFVVGRAKISSYYGYDWHLSADYQYRKFFTHSLSLDKIGLDPRPDWSWVIKTGASFVVYEDGNPGNDPLLENYIDMNNPAHVLRVGPNGKFVIAPIKKEVEAPPYILDNGFIALTGNDSASQLRNFKTNYASRISFQVESKDSLTIRYLFWPNKYLRVSLDGNPIDWATDGNVFFINCPAGSHSIVIEYVNWWTRLFLVSYVAFVLLWVFALLSPARVWSFSRLVED